MMREAFMSKDPETGKWLKKDFFKTKPDNENHFDK